MAVDQEIYTGFWTNYAYGSVFGATLTLNARDGAYLIAFLALFVHVAGASFWRLFCYGAFQYRANPELRGDTALKEQLVLRNSLSSASGLRSFIFLTRRARDNVRRSTIALLCVSAINLIAFVAAGILSSKITATQPDVLLRPRHCGRWWDFDYVSRQINGFAPSSEQIEYARKARKILDLRHASNDYATTCYQGEISSQECTSFERRIPTWTKSIRSRCPFGADLCAGHTMLSLDSGLLDSTLDFGINTPVEDRLSLRLTKECAPLAQNSYIKTYDGSNITQVLNPSGWPSIQVAAVSTLGLNWERYQYEAHFYGPDVQIEFYNATYLFSNATTTIQAPFPGMLGTQSVLLIPYRSFPCPDGRIYVTPLTGGTGCTNKFVPGSRFDPIPGLWVADRDTVLLMLTWDVASSKPIADPWFRTDVEFDFLPEVQYYQRQYITSALACTEKTEICKQSDTEPPLCTQLNPYGLPMPSSNNVTRNLTNILGLTPRQTTVANRLQDAVWMGDFFDTLQDLNADSLLANKQIVPPIEIINHLPNDQWVREVEHWFAMQLIIMQSGATKFVTGWQDEWLNDRLKPLAEDEMWMCGSQVIQRRDFASFSVLGLGIIIGIGGVIILLNAGVTWTVNRLRPRNQVQMYKQESWRANDLLELRVGKEDRAHYQSAIYAKPAMDKKEARERSATAMADFKMDIK